MGILYKQKTSKLLLIAFVIEQQMYFAATTLARKLHYDNTKQQVTC